MSGIHYSGQRAKRSKVFHYCYLLIEIFGESFTGYMKDIVFADTFVLEVGGGHDLVTDFLSLTDVLDVSDFGFADGAAVLAATSNVNGSAVITLSPGETVTLDGVLKAELDQADFIV